MRSSYFRSMSLKAKMALAITALFIIFILSASYFTFSYFERTTKESISIQQFALVSSLAQSIDDKLRIAHSALLGVATSIPKDAWTNADKAQRFLDERIGLKSIFVNNNIALLTPEGKLIAESRYVAGRRGQDFSYREWVRKTVDERKPYISKPYISRHGPNHPKVMLTAPVFDDQGKVIGILGGSLDLLGENFLANISRITIGRGGYLYISDSNRILIVHPDKGRIMKPTVPGQNRLYDRAVKGFEGSGETINSYHTPMLTSYKRLETTTWILAANYPASEAYAPLEKAKQYYLAAALATTTVLLLITWVIMKHLMSPLVVVTRHVQHLPEKSGDERHVIVDSADEIGILATAFNSMIDTLDEQYEELNVRNKAIEDEHFFLQALMDAIPDMIFYKDQNSVYRGCNKSCASLFMGMRPEQVIGHTDYDFVPPEVAELFQQQDRKTIESAQPTRHEEWLELTDGRRVLVETIKVPFRNSYGAVVGVIGIARDITEHKRVEEALQEQTAYLKQEIVERQVAQEELAVKQRQLEELNQSLEERITVTVSALRQKDQALIQQNRLAVMGEMINNIAHQWRNPLNNIGLIVQSIGLDAENGSLKETNLSKDISTAMHIIGFMSRTIDDFRKFSLQDKQKSGFMVSEAVSGALEIISASLKSNNIRVELALDDTVTVTGYRNEYGQALLNILANARDILLERCVTVPLVRIELCSELGCSVLTISDNAGGIPNDVLPRIFDLYFSTKEPGKGTGIGLYMSKVIIEQNMGGRLTARNTGDGAEFRIEV